MLNCRGQRVGHNSRLWKGSINWSDRSGQAPTVSYRKFAYHEKFDFHRPTNRGQFPRGWAFHIVSPRQTDQAPEI